MNKVLSVTAAMVTVGALMVTSASTAEAAFKMRLSDGGVTVIVTDQGLNDGSLAPGLISFNDAVGTWVANISTGVSGPVAAPPFPHMDLNSINISGGQGTMTIELTDTDLSYGDPVAGFKSALGGVTNGTMSFQAYVNTDNGEFSTAGTKVADFGPYSGAFSNTAYNSALVDGAYSVTLVATVTHTSAGQLTSFNGELQIPEPGSLALFGLGLLGLGFLARRRMA